MAVAFQDSRLVMVPRKLVPTSKVCVCALLRCSSFWRVVADSTTDDTFGTMSTTDIRIPIRSDRIPAEESSDIMINPSSTHPFSFSSVSFTLLLSNKYMFHKMRTRWRANSRDYGAFVAKHDYAHVTSRRLWGGPDSH